MLFAKRAVAFVVFLVAAGAASNTVTVTWTGWFSDEQCASGRVKAGLIGPTNPECAKSCLQKGAQPVFISEQAKAMFTVKGYPPVADDLGYHVRIVADLDEAAHTVSIQKVERLSEYEGPSCGRPRKTGSH